MTNVPRDVKSGKGVTNMYTLMMEGNEIFRTTGPRGMTSKLFGKKKRVHFKNNVRTCKRSARSKH